MVAGYVLSKEEYAQILSALKSAHRAAVYVIGICEDDLKAGLSPNPRVKSNPNGVMAHCYGAMSYNSEVIEAIKLLEKEPDA